MSAASVLGFELLRPGLAVLALAALAVLALGLAALAAARRGRRVLVAARHLERFLPDRASGAAPTKLALAVLATGLLAFAALGPVRGYTLREVRRTGLDLVLCVDTSRSMLVQDLAPDRLARAKRELRGLLGKLQDDRAALLAFAGDVRLVAPLTRDRVTLIGLLEGLDPGENLLGGTDVGQVLRAALELFDGRTGAHEAIVLITDGEDLEGKGLEAAAEAAQLGIRVYVVGMGTEAGGKIPGERGFVRDEAGAEVVSRLDGTTLEQIAEVTGGAYLSAERSPFPLEEIFAERISTLEGRELLQGKERVPHDRFQWALVPAALAMLGAVGLRERRSARRRNGRGRSSRAKDKALAAALALLAPLFFADAARAQGTAPAPDASRKPEAPAPEPPRSLREGFERMEALAKEGRGEDADLLGERLLAPPAFEAWRAGLEPGMARRAVDLAAPLVRLVAGAGRSALERAAIRQAQGLALFAELADDADAPSAPDPAAAEARDALRLRAEDRFEAVRGLAGSGELGLDATRDLALLDLDEGERWRAQIPEISGESPQGAPGAPGAPGQGLLGGAGPSAPPAQGGAAEEDPLQRARGAYLRARAGLIERLRMDWRDPPTRKDAELVQRRLRELDAIERQREEQEQEQQKQQQQQDQQSQDSEPQDPQDSEDPQQGEQDPEDQPQEPEEGEKPEQPEPEPGEEPEPEEQEGEEQPPPAAEAGEQELTREEVQRLLDLLRQIEEQGEALRARMRAARRARVDKDW